jgi:hypothetical protein
VAIFKNSDFEFLRAFDRTPGGQKSGEIEFTVNNVVHLRSNPVAMPGESPWSSPSPLCPDPGRATWEEKAEAARTPLLCPSSLCTTPTVVASPPPTHSTPSPRPSPSSMPPRPPRTASVMHVARNPCAGHLLGTLALGLLAYKNPLRAHEWTRTTPSKLPNTFPSSRSLSFAAAIDAGELLDAGGAAASGLRWASGRREVGRSAAGVFSAPRRQALLPLRVSPSPSSSSLDAGEPPPSPLDTTQTRRWIRIQRQRTDSGDLSHLTHRPRLSVRFRTFPAPCEAVLGRPVWVSIEISPVRSNLVRIFLIISRSFLNCFKYVSDMIFKL